AALAAAGGGPAPDGLDPLVLQDTLSAAYAGNGRHQDAIRLGRRALADRERRQGSEHPDTMATRANLTGYCLAAGQMKDAIGYAKRTLADRERVLGHDHPATMGSVSGLATAYHSARRPTGALPPLQRPARPRG